MGRICGSTRPKTSTVPGSKKSLIPNFPTQSSKMLSELCNSKGLDHRGPKHRMVARLVDEELKLQQQKLAENTSDKNAATEVRKAMELGEKMKYQAEMEHLKREATKFKHDGEQNSKTPIKATHREDKGKSEDTAELEAMRGAPRSRRRKPRIQKRTMPTSLKYYESKRWTDKILGPYLQGLDSVL